MHTQYIIQKLLILSFIRPIRKYVDSHETITFSDPEKWELFSRAIVEMVNAHRQVELRLHEAINVSGHGDVSPIFDGVVTEAVGTIF